MRANRFSDNHSRVLMFIENDRQSKEKRISLAYARFSLCCWFYRMITNVKTWQHKYYQVSPVVSFAISDITQCFYNNVTYAEGEGFPDIDGCNNWYEPHTCI